MFPRHAALSLSTLLRKRTKLCLERRSKGRETFVCDVKQTANLDLHFRVCVRQLEKLVENCNCWRKYVIDIKKLLMLLMGKRLGRKFPAKFCRAMARLLRPISYKVFPPAKENANFCYLPWVWLHLHFRGNWDLMNWRWR